MFPRVGEGKLPQNTASLLFVKNQQMLNILTSIWSIAGNLGPQQIGTDRLIEVGRCQGLMINLACCCVDWDLVDPSACHWVVLSN